MTRDIKMLIISGGLALAMLGAWLLYNQKSDEERARDLGHDADLTGVGRGRGALFFI